jgi:putative SOS response-associated peptidase YedK
MCGGVEYVYQNPGTGETVNRKTYFPIPAAEIPVLTESGIQLVRWGKRRGEDVGIDVPETGWARLQSLAEHKWDRYVPHRVKIPVLRWMEKDRQKQSHWFDVDPGTYLLGVQIDKPERSYVYVVTRQTQGDFAKIHDREPLLTR